MLPNIKYFIKAYQSTANGHSLAPKYKNIKKSKIVISTISILAGIGLFTVYRVIVGGSTNTYRHF